MTSTLQTVMYHTHYGMELGKMGLIWPELAAPPTQDSWNLRAEETETQGGGGGENFLKADLGCLCPKAPFSCGMCICLGLAPGRRCRPGTAHTLGQVALLVGAQPCR